MAHRDRGPIVLLGQGKLRQHLPGTWAESRRPISFLKVENASLYFFDILMMFVLELNRLERDRIHPVSLGLPSARSRHVYCLYEGLRLGRAPGLVSLAEDLVWLWQVVPIGELDLALDNVFLVLWLPLRLDMRSVALLVPRLPPKLNVLQALLNILQSETADEVLLARFFVELVSEALPDRWAIALLGNCASSAAVPASTLLNLEARP